MILLSSLFINPQYLPESQLIRYEWLVTSVLGVVVSVLETIEVIEQRYIK